MAQTVKASMKGYRIKLPIPKDGEIVDTVDPDDKDRGHRNRVLRWVNLILSATAMLVVPTLLLWWWGSLIDCPAIGALIGCGAGVYFASTVISSRFLIDNPEWTAYVTQNMFGGEMVPYGPGLHPSFWWEERNEEGNHSLEAIPLPFSVPISTKSSKVTISGEYEYAIRLSTILRAIGVSEATIESDITPFIESFLLSECAGHDAQWAREHKDELNDKLAERFMGIEIDGEKITDFEDRYGLISVSIVINKIALPDDVQKTLDAIDEGANQLKVIAQMYGYGKRVKDLQADIKSGKITHKMYTEMVEHAMATSKNATMNIQVFRGDIPSSAASLAKGEKTS